jgi:superoxide dismutase, Fe-Mn family
MVKRIFMTVVVMVIAGAGLVQAQTAVPETVAPEQKPKPAFEAKDFTALVGLPGFSEAILKNHFKLYQGYVKNVNTLLDKLSALVSEGKEKSPEYGELKRRFGWEYDGMVMHEYYFSNLGGTAAFDPESALYKKITADFGSFEAWKKDFLATASIRGIGWAVLYQEPKSGKLINAWINEHDCGHLAGATPILVIDVFEHAFILDYQTDRAAYLEAVWKAINWKVVAERLK